MTGQDGTPGRAPRKGGRKAKSAAEPAAASEKPVARKKRDPEPDASEETRPSEPFRLRGAPVYFGSGG